MHIPDETQVLLVSARLAYGAPPFFNGFQNLRLDFRISNRGSFGKTPNKLVQELLGTDLKMKRVSAILDTYIKEVEGQEADVT